MKTIFQILFLLLTWFSNLSARPVFTKVVIPNYEIKFSNFENVKNESVVKIRVQNFARSGILENSFYQKSTSRVSYALLGASHACERKVVIGAGKLLNAEGKFIDNLLETDYAKYLTRKTTQGKTPRGRLDWKEARDYWLFDSPMARGNSFNKKAFDLGWYDYFEINLANGKRLDSYVPPSNGKVGEIISRKATNLEEIELSPAGLSVC